MLYETEIIRFSNTIGTNTIIQRDGSKIGLLVTAGKEVLAPTGSDDGKSPLVLPDMVLGVEEAVSPVGEVIKSPDEQAVLVAAQALIDRGARCLVVAFGHSEFNPANERLVRQAVKREYSRDFLGSVPVFLSSDISRRSGESERINAAVLNAYIHAKLVRLLYKAGEELRQRLYQKSLFIVHSNGAVARVAKTRAINTYNSGPAAGLLGARLIGKLYRAEDLISADMGGTSFDLGYVSQGQASYTLSPDVEGFPVNVPMLAIRAIGAGGGSIASVREGKLFVGPQSAGALPGPVCFDLGGAAPTVTDADLVLGILDPDYFLGGSFKLNQNKAIAAIEEKVAGPLGISVEAAALAIKAKVDENMGREMVKLKQEMGPQRQPLLMMYGGAGPAHCCDIARRAGLKMIVITPFSAVFSAFSSSSMDVGHLYYRRVDLPLDGANHLGVLADSVAAMRKETERDMRGEGFSMDKVSFILELFVQGKGSGAEVKVAASVDFFQEQSKIARVMEQAYQALAGIGQREAGGLMLTSIGLLAQAPMPHYEIETVPLAATSIGLAQKGSRKVFLESAGAQEVPIYERSKLTNGHRIMGPAVVESEQTTLLLPLGWGFRVDQYDNAILEEVGKP
jgi:N-methylhydantoinase A/acetophenone carboxylase